MSLCCAFMAGQAATDIYLFDLKESDNQITISNPINISNKEGYDNQPSFTEDGSAILYASYRDGQADIASYSLSDNKSIWLTDSKDSEFSPVAVPGKKKYFTCVRLNEDQSQYLYKFSMKKGTAEVLIPDVTVGYYLWFDPKTVISFVIGDIETMQVNNFKYKIQYPIQNNIGRSIQNIPPTAGLGKKLVSFISLNHESPEIYSINPMNSVTKYITDAVGGSQDLAWTKKGTMLMGKGDTIYKYHPDVDKQWVPITIEGIYEIDGITRMTVSPDGSKIAIVVSEPEK